MHNGLVPLGRTVVDEPDEEASLSSSQWVVVSWFGSSSEPSASSSSARLPSESSLVEGGSVTNAWVTGQPASERSWAAFAGPQWRSSTVKSCTMAKTCHERRQGEQSGESRPRWRSLASAATHKMGFAHRAGYAFLRTESRLNGLGSTSFMPLDM